MTVANLKPEDEAHVKHVVAKFDSAKDHHAAFRRKVERHYSLYRSYRDFKRSHAEANGTDVDSILRDGESTFGTGLFIPYCFSVIETTLPRMLSNNPRMLVTPRRPEDEDNVEPVKLMIDAQQRDQRYALTLQTVGKSGLMYGLGVQKVTWDKKFKRNKKVLVRATDKQASGGADWVEGKRDQLVFEGPKAEAVNVLDWIWDPYGWDMETIGWCIHRTWRDDRYVRGMIEREASPWKLPENVDLERDVLGQGSDSGRAEIYAGMDDASGYGGRKKAKLHEVWEFHDGDQVITILDRSIPVQVGPNPYWHGELPFQIFRPTEVIHEMVGIGEIEAIEDLQIEMNTLRSQRRDNALLVLQRPFAYFDGIVDPADIAYGAGIGIPVDGDPRNAIFPLPVQDLPNAGYQEDASLQRDIERTTGIDDTVSGAGGGDQTATGVQLVQAAANVRIQMKTTRCEEEVVAPACGQFCELNQQHIISEKVIAGPPKEGETDRKFSWYTVSPEVLAGDFFFECEGGSTQPDNPVQKANEAQALIQDFGQDPHFDARKLRVEALKKLGFANPESLLLPEDPQVPLHALEMVREALSEEAQTQPDRLIAELATNPGFFDQLVQGAAQPDASAPTGENTAAQAPPMPAAPAAV